MPHFIALETAHNAVRDMFSILRLLPPGWQRLADQVKRSGPSVVLNLAEGNGRSGRDRAQHFRIAYGSSLETTATLRILRDAGAVSAERVDPVLALFDRVKRLTWGLLHPH